MLIYQRVTTLARFLSCTELIAIKALPMPNEPVATQAIGAMQKTIDLDYSDVFSLPAVCIGEFVSPANSEKTNLVDINFFDSFWS